MGRGVEGSVSLDWVIAHAAVSATSTKLARAVGSFEQLTSSDSCVQDVVDKKIIALIALTGQDKGTNLINGRCAAQSS